MTELYTDGSCWEGVGGWAWAIPDLELADSGGFVEGATNQVMEMYAVIRGLRAAIEHGLDKVRLVSDSAYVINCMNDGWYRRWGRKGWRTGAGKPVANLELWHRMHSLADRIEVEWVHTRGHIGVAGNELVDRLAGEERRRLSEVGA